LAGLLVGVTLGAVAAALAFVRPQALESAELWTYDVRARHGAHPEWAAKDIVILDVGEQDLEDVENNLGLTWPWPRALFGYLAEYASGAGAKAVVFDWIFQDRGSYATDDLEGFAASLETSQRAVFGLVMPKPAPGGHAPLAQGTWGALLRTFPTRSEAVACGLVLLGWNTRVFLSPPRGEGATTLFYGGKKHGDEVTATWQRLSATEELVPFFQGEPDTEPAPPAPRVLSPSELEGELEAEAIVREGNGLSLIVPSEVQLSERALDPPLAILAAAATRLGHVVQEAETDGIIRRHAYLVGHDGRLYASLALAAYLVGHRQVTPAFDGATLVLGERRVPVDKTGKSGVRFHGSGTTYPHVNAYRVLQAQALVDEGKPSSLPPETFRDKYVIVSATAHALRDLRVSPVDTVHLGAEINANALDNLLQGHFVRRASPWTDAGSAFLLALALALAVVAIWTSLRSAMGALLATLALAVAAIYGFWHLADRLYDARGLWIAVVTPATGGVIAGFAALLATSTLERKDRRFIQEALGRYTSAELVRELMAHPEQLSLEWGEKREMSVYFSDIAGFTSFSEALPPERLVALLNEYLTSMTDIVLAHGGIVDKYIGDAIMAFWGAPISETEHAQKAVRCALAMRRRCDELRPAWRAEYGPTVIARAGINSGLAVVGNMGSKHKYNYTVMGDMVNLASRLEGANKPYGTTLMISETTYALCKDVVDVRELDLLAVKGKEKPVTVYEVLAERGQTPAPFAATMAAYHEGLEHYRQQRFSDARAAFTRALALSPDDGPSQTYVARCEHFLATPPDPDWDGVWHMKEK
jgi:adenylate cyclase